MSVQTASRAFGAALAEGEPAHTVAIRVPEPALLPVPVASGPAAPAWITGLGRRARVLVRSAGFAPLLGLLERYPKIALGFSLPVLILSLIGLARGDLLAPVLGLYALGVGLIFANIGAHELARDRAAVTSDRPDEE
jgi:hypothetical protein